MPKSSKPKKTEEAANNKIVAVILIIVGLACLLGAVIFFLDSLTASEPVGLGKWIFDILVLLLGAGASIKGWKDVFKKNKPYAPSLRIVAMDEAQVATGENGRNIKQGDNSKYFERIDHYHEAPSEAPKTTYGLFTIPRPVTDFTGRETELAQLKESFTNGAIITGLSGAGGIGKTELARKLAHEIAENFPNAQMNIDLLGTSEKPTSPEDVMRRLLEPFYVGQKLPDDETQLKGLYQETFGKKKVLLLLDNAATAAQVRPLIPPAPSAAIITSRQNFSLTEFGFQEPLRLDVLSPEESREFLLSASGKLNATPAEKVDELANLCGHLPLALRVAVSLLNDRMDWTLDNLLERLANQRTRLQRLRRENDTDLDVEAAITLSYDLLPDDIKQRFRMLGAFVGPFWSHSVSAVWDSNDQEDVDASLGVLLTRNLLNSQNGPFGFVDSDEIKTMNYYTFHDLTFLFASNQLIENRKEAKETIERHTAYFLGLARLANDEYAKGHDHIQNALNIFRGTWQDIFMAWNRMLPNQHAWPRPEHSDSWISEFPVRCANMLMLFVRPVDRIKIIEIALETAHQIGDKPSEGANLANLGISYNEMGETTKAIELFEKAFVFSQDINDPILRAKVVGGLGVAYTTLGEEDKAIKFYEQALQLFRDSRNLNAEGGVLLNMGSTYLALGRASEAFGLFENGLRIALEVGDRLLQSAALANIGKYYSNAGDAQKAIEYYEQALNVTNAIGYKKGQDYIFGGMGTVFARLGDKAKALEFYEKQLAVAREADDRRTESEALVNMGIVNRNLGNVEKAKDLWGEAIVIYETIGDDSKTDTIKGWIEKIKIDEEKNLPVYDRVNILETSLATIEPWDFESNPGNEFVELPENLIPAEVAALNNLGDAYTTAGEPRKALPVLERALAILKSSGDETRLANKYVKGKVLGNLGIAFFWIGEHEKAMEYLEKQLAIAREVGDKASESGALGNIGNIFSKLGGLQTALGYYEKQLTLVRELEYKQGECDALANMGVALSNSGDSLEAMKVYEQALALAQEMGDRITIGKVLTNIGLIHDERGNFKEAINSYEQALDYLREMGNQIAVGETLLNLGTTYGKIGEIDKRLELWQEGLEIFKSKEDPRVNQVEKKITQASWSSGIKSFVRDAIRAQLTKSDQAAYFLGEASNMAVDSDLPLEYQELGKVLQRILTGIKNPDLSQLPEELADLVKSELEK